jgi:hypothetical protein
VLFALPVLAIVSLPLVLGVYMGEAMPVSGVVAIQQDTPGVVYGPSDRETIFAYKLLAANTRQPEVLVVGSSRTLQIRSWMFARQPEAFYNAGGEAWGLREIRAFLRQLSYSPRILIVGLDQPWFNADFVDWEEVPPSLDTAPLDIERTFGAARALMDTVVDQEIDLQSVFDRHIWVDGSTGLGLHALRFGSGYRNDGSYQDGNILVNPDLAEVARAHDLEAAPTGWRQFVQGSEVDERRLRRLDEFLDESQARGIMVVGVSPPFMPSIYRTLIEGGNNTYIEKANAAIAALFDAYGFPYFDFSDATQVGGNDTELYDGWHPTELLAGRMVVHMAEAQPDLFAPYVDVAALEQTLAGAENPIEVMPDWS